MCFTQFVYIIMYGNTQFGPYLRDKLTLVWRCLLSIHSFKNNIRKVDLVDSH